MLLVLLPALLLHRARVNDVALDHHRLLHLSSIVHLPLLEQVKLLGKPEELQVCLQLLHLLGVELGGLLGLLLVLKLVVEWCVVLIGSEGRGGLGLLVTH